MLTRVLTLSVKTYRSVTHPKSYGAALPPIALPSIASQSQWGIIRPKSYRASLHSIASHYPPLLPIAFNCLPVPVGSYPPQKLQCSIASHCLPLPPTAFHCLPLPPSPIAVLAAPKDTYRAPLPPIAKIASRCLPLPPIASHSMGVARPKSSPPLLGGECMKRRVCESMAVHGCPVPIP